MSPRIKLLLPIFLIAAGSLVLWLWTSEFRNSELTPRASAAARFGSAPRSVPDPLPTAFTKLNPDSGPIALPCLLELQEKLKSMPASEAVNWIRSFLSSGQDKSTGLTFEINADGTLKEWPTFRTFLLDSVLLIDPASAAAISREILASPTTADEWALALRNVGKMETSAESDSFLVERTMTLINHPDWQANPSIGYLNAFDVLVHTNATESAPLLSSLIQRKDRKDLAHAGFLTLDQLVQKSPAETLTRIAADTALQQSRPEMTAQQFARADLRDPLQREIVKNWLLDPNRTGTELRSFAGVYPNNNHFVSNNLITTEATQSGAELATHDREALEILRTWAADPTFRPLNNHLSTMIGRLNGFVRVPPAPLEN